MKITENKSEWSLIGYFLDRLVSAGNGRRVIKEQKASSEHLDQKHQCGQPTQAECVTHS
jgi:hypothetical protein